MEVLFIIVILSCFLVLPLFHEFSGTLVVWCGVLAVLLGFFFALTRFVIREVI